MRTLFSGEGIGPLSECKGREPDSLAGGQFLPHQPLSVQRGMMRLCDQEGIVVIDETTAVGVNLEFGGGANFNGQKISTFDKEHGVQTQEHHKEVIRDLIARDKIMPVL